MTNITRMFITEVGQQALWNSQNTGVDFEVTHIQLGSSNRNYGAEATSVGLAEVEQTETIKQGELITKNQIRIFADIEGVKDFSVFEIGLWSGDPSKAGSVLFAYGVNKDTQFLRISNGLNLVFSYDFIFTDHDVSNVTIIVDGDQSRITAMLERHELDDNAHPYYAHKEQDNTLNGSNTFTKPINADLSGNATTSDKLKTARTIALNGAVTGTATSFDGSANITIPTTQVDGSKVTGTVPKATTADTATKATTADTATKATTADTATKATTADTATKLTTARKIHGVEFDGTKDINLKVFSSSSSGVVPQSDYDEGDKVKFLGDDGNWQAVDIDDSKTAETLKTARTIGISGAVTGTATSFDGSKNITIPTTQVDATKLTGIVPSANLAVFSANGVGAVPKREGTTTTKFLREDGTWQVINTGSAENAKTADKLTTARTIALSGAVTGTATSFDGSANITIPTTQVDAQKIEGIIPNSNLNIGKDIDEIPVNQRYGLNRLGYGGISEPIANGKDLRELEYSIGWYTLAGTYANAPSEKSVYGQMLVSIGTYGTTGSAMIFQLWDQSIADYWVGIAYYTDDNSNGKVKPSSKIAWNKVVYATDKVSSAIKADTADTATKLTTARTIALSGAVTGTATSFDGSANITIPTTAVDAKKIEGTIPNSNLNIGTNINEIPIYREYGIDGLGYGYISQAITNGSDLCELEYATGWHTLAGTYANAPVTTTMTAQMLVSVRAYGAGSAIIFQLWNSMAGDYWVGVAQYSSISDRKVKPSSVINWKRVAYTTDNVASATVISIDTSETNQIMETGSEESTAVKGLSIRSIYQGLAGGYPCNYGNLIRIKSKADTATTEILHEWTSGKTRLFVRARADIVGTHVWTDFRELAFKDEVSSLNGHTVDVTSSRAKDTIYTNTTGALLGVMVSSSGSSNHGGADLVINGISIFNNNSSATYSLTGFVGNLETYKVTGVLQKFIEHTSSSAKLVKAIDHESGLDEMEYYKKKDTSDIYAFSSDGSQDFLITEDFVKLTDDEKDRHLYPEKYMTEEELEAYEKDYLQDISKAQFQLVLLEENRLDDFESLISKVPDAKIRRKIEIIYQSSAEFKRESDFSDLIVSTKIFTDKELNSIWKKAIKIAV